MKKFLNIALCAIIVCGTIYPSQHNNTQSKKVSFKSEPEIEMYSRHENKDELWYTIQEEDKMLQAYITELKKKS